MTPERLRVELDSPKGIFNHAILSSSKDFQKGKHRPSEPVQRIGSDANFDDMHRIIPPSLAEAKAPDRISASYRRHLGSKAHRVFPLGDGLFRITPIEAVP